MFMVTKNVISNRQLAVRLLSREETRALAEEFKIELFLCFCCFVLKTRYKRDDVHLEEATGRSVLLF